MTLSSFLYTIIGCLTSRQAGICSTPACIETANVLAANMRSISPAYRINACIDFYDYACGKYKDETPLPPGKHAVMLNEFPQQEINRIIAGLLGQPNNPNDPQSLRRVRSRYQECIRNSQQSTATSQCVNSMKNRYPKAIVYLLVEAFNGHEMKRKIQTVFDNVRASFVKKILASWLDDPIKVEAIRKIGSVGSLILFTEDMLNPNTLDQPDNVERPTDILGEHVEYNYQQHAIGVPFLATKIPYYSFGLESMDYGALAYVLGHELDHLLDPTGAPFNSNNQRSGWWTRSLQQQYSARTLPFILQYNQFTDNGIRVNGENSVIENIHDNTGHWLAFDAWRTHATRQKKLTRFEDFTPEQLFTLASASIHCERLTAEGTQRLITHFSHAPGSARVNGVAMNSLEFSNIWNCNADAPMNPSDKNDIWAEN